MIDCQGLTKQYGRLQAVDDLSFACAGRGARLPGSERRRQDHDHADHRGLSARRRPARAKVSRLRRRNAGARRRSSRIGYLPEGAPSYPEMTPRSFLDFVAAARGIPSARSGARASTK